ncbi:MAG: hypothetical protein VSS75_020045 [Candidatus Parabeggiatoa sp.]|nr:hypothetical protein [Candidatus Parabeggiatoa sp.]
MPRVSVSRRCIARDARPCVSTMETIPYSFSRKSFCAQKLLREKYF